MSLDPLLAAPAIIQAHVVLALLAVLLGPAALLRRSRDIWHRQLGRAWVAAMAGTALTSFFITENRTLGPFSLIHVLSILTLVGLWEGVAQARAGRIAEHRRTMLTVFSGAVGVAGLFTLLPGRRMSDALFSAAPWFGFAGMAILVATGLVLAWRRTTVLRQESRTR
ncbi:MAG: DUF2306 domain-containing protein [Tabrizicola sp.]|nr:DUF2306 domain-containing protein [Tabrizicola sp.]